MGYFSEERVSVEPPSPSTTPANSAIQRALLRLSSLTAGAGGILHFTVGIYRITAAETVAQAAVVFPAGVTLRFDEGAVLDLQPNAHIEIGGLIDAGASTIFRTIIGAWWTAAGDRPSVGQIVFTGKAYTRLIPEWWGAGSGDPAHDTHALQAALNAGFSDRFRAIAGGVVIDPPIPVELMGTYGIDRALVIDASPAGHGHPAVESFVLRGTRVLESAAGALPTLQWVGERDSGPMILSNWAVGVSIENLSLDGAGWVGICLKLQSGQRRHLSGPAAQMPQVRDCAFRGATDALVHLGGDVGGDSAQDLLNPSFVRCSFELSPVVGFLPAGLRLNASETFGILISRCTFWGAASAFIHAFSGMITLDGCRFDNRAQNKNVQGNGPNAVDIYLDVVRDRIVPAGLTITNCETWSAQFLGSSDTGPMGAPLWHTTILGFNHHHTPVVGTAADQIPVIYWGSVGRSSTKTEQWRSLVLLLAGCSFNGQVSIRADEASVVVDFGSNFGVGVPMPWFNLVGGPMLDRVIQLSGMAVLR